MKGNLQTEGNVGKVRPETTMALGLLGRMNSGKSLGTSQVPNRIIWAPLGCMGAWIPSSDMDVCDSALVAMSVLQNLFLGRENGTSFCLVQLGLFWVSSHWVCPFLSEEYGVFNYSSGFTCFFLRLYQFSPHEFGRSVIRRIYIKGCWVFLKKNETLYYYINLFFIPDNFPFVKWIFLKLIYLHQLSFNCITVMCLALSCIPSLSSWSPSDSPILAHEPRPSTDAGHCSTGSGSAYALISLTLGTAVCSVTWVLWRIQEELETVYRVFSCCGGRVLTSLLTCLVGSLTCLGSCTQPPVAEKCYSLGSSQNCKY